MDRKLLYIANVRFPTEKAHGLQIAKTCEALSERGALEALWIPNRKNDIPETPEAYYGLRQALPVRRLATWDLVHWGFIGFLVETFSFIYGVIRALQHQRVDAMLYGRDELVMGSISMVSSQPFIWETHTGAWNVFARRAAFKAHAIITISEGLKEFYVERGIAPEKITVAPDAIDPLDFLNPGMRTESREQLGLPQDKKIALYIGSLDEPKGATTLCEAATFLSDVLVVIVGGRHQQIAALQKKFPAVKFCGPRPYRDIAQNQIAGDVLVLPNSAKDVVSDRFTSPLKLYAYMTSRVPIVASDLPSIREALDENACYFFRPDDPKSLAAAIQKALEEPVESARRAEEAYKRSKQCTWAVRADTILSTL